MDQSATETKAVLRAFCFVTLWLHYGNFNICKRKEARTCVSRHRNKYQSY